MAYSLNFKLKIIKHCKRSITPISQMSIIRRVPRRTIYQWINDYKKYGVVGLKNKKPGVKKDLINPKFKEEVIISWIKGPRGVHKMWLDYKNNDLPLNKTKGWYRKLTKRNFEYVLYTQRNITETIFSSLKRKYGSKLRARNFKTQKIELLLKTLSL